MDKKGLVLGNAKNDPDRQRGDKAGAKSAPRGKSVDKEKDIVIDKTGKKLIEIFNKNADLLWKYLVVPVYVKRSNPTPSHYDYSSWQALACVNKSLHIAMCKFTIKKKNQEIQKLQNLERDLRGEVAQFWKAQWKRLQDVTEENRRLRYLPLEKEEKKAAVEEAAKVVPSATTPIWAKKPLSREEARQTLKEIGSYNPDDIGLVAKQELIHLKTAFAQFFTSWSRAAEIATTVGQEEDFRKHIFAMANVPKDWSTKEWAKQAVYSMTGRQKKDEQG